MRVPFTYWAKSDACLFLRLTNSRYVSSTVTSHRSSSTSVPYDDAIIDLPGVSTPFYSSSHHPLRHTDELLRAVLNEGSISHRVQYMIEVLMQVHKDKYKDNPILPEGLDLVDEEQITHKIQLEEVEDGFSMYSIC